MGEYVDPTVVYDPARTPLGEALARWYIAMIEGRDLDEDFMQEVMLPLPSFTDWTGLEGTAPLNPLFLTIAAQSLAGGEENRGLRDAILRRYADNENLVGWSPFKGKPGQAPPGSKIPIKPGPYSPQYRTSADSRRSTTPTGGGHANTAPRKPSGRVG